MGWYFDNDSGLNVEVPDLTAAPMLAGMTVAPVQGYPPAPPMGDLIMVSKRGRYDGADFIPIKEKRWGVEGLLAAPSGGTLHLGIITGVAKSRPGVRVDSSDALGAPWAVAVYPGVIDFTVTAVFLGTEAPAIGDTLHFSRDPVAGSPGRTMKVASVSEQWSEGQFCGAQLACLAAPAGWTSYNPLNEITNLA